MSTTSSPTDADANSSISRHFEQVADAVEPALRWAACSSAEHADWSRTFAGRLKRLVGTLPPQVPLEVRWDEVVDLGTVVRRKIYVRSEAHYWVPAYYFVPKDVPGQDAGDPLPARPQRHRSLHPRGRRGPAPPRAGSWTWTTPSIWPSTDTSRWRRCSAAGTRPHCRRTRPRAPTVATASPWTAFLLGMTPVGLRCWDASRLLDFLETQEPVDRERIGVAGLSGGGTTGLYLAALEPRIGLAMIGGYYCTFRDSIFSIYHCICNCVPRGDAVGGDAGDRGRVRAQADADHRRHPRRDLSDRGHQASLSGAGRGLRAARRAREPRSRFLRRPSTHGTTARRSRSCAGTGAGCERRGGESVHPFADRPSRQQE